MMDHVMFLAQQRMEAIQVTAGVACAGLGQQAAGFKAGVAAHLHNTAAALMPFQERVTGSVIAKWAQEMLERLQAAHKDFRLGAVYDRCLVFLLYEVTRTHMYLGGACFIVGMWVGVTVAAQWRQSVAAPQKMRAVVATSYMGVEGISMVEDMIAPQLVSRDQLLVKVKAAGIDQLDINIAAGYGRIRRCHLNRYNPNSAGELPVVLGRDCAGVVVAVGVEVEEFAPGDEVWLAVPLHHPGTLSEYIAVNAALVAHKPVELSFEAAAALPFALMQAWSMLGDQAGVTGEEETKGKRFLVHNGGSSVGVVLVQLVAAWGGHVTVTLGSSREEALLRTLGAQDVICADAHDVEEQLRLRGKFNVILNSLGPVLHDASVSRCLPGGVVVTSVLPPLPSDSYGLVLGTMYSVYLGLHFLFTKSRWQHGSWYSCGPRVSSEVLQRAAVLVAAGRLQAIVDKAYNCQDAEAAFAHIVKTQKIGKTVIRFRSRPLTSQLKLV